MIERPPRWRSINIKNITTRMSPVIIIIMPHQWKYKSAVEISPVFWIVAYKYYTLIHNRIMHGKLGPHSTFQVPNARRPWFDRLRIVFCDMWEWLPGPKTPGIYQGRYMICLGISYSCDTGYLTFEPESRTVRTVYNDVLFLMKPSMTLLPKKVILKPS